MDFIIDAIVEWLKGLLVDGIMGNLDGLFNNVNQSVGEIATQVGTTPADWNAGVFSMIRQISETAILPIAGVILTFVMTYELIQMLIDRNNLHDVDTWMFFKWVFKTFVAVMILTNTFNIVLAVFDVSQHVIQQSAGIIQNGTEITTDVMDSLRTELEAMELGPLFGLWLQSFLIQLTMIALNIVIFVIVYGRMIEIYLLTSLAPIPFATVVATHFSCPIITLVVCHRINRYNDMGTEKGKGFRTLIFCTELSPETITKTMVIISKYEVEYKETEDIFNRQ